MEPGFFDPGYEWTNPSSDSDLTCKAKDGYDATSNPDAEVIDHDVQTPADADVYEDTKVVEPAQPDVITPTACITEALCAATSDCQQGQRCNLRLSPPKCQNLYCAKEHEACDPDQGDALCNQGLSCVDAAEPYCCKPACDAMECGSDAICGASCGECGAGTWCLDSKCADDRVWLLRCFICDVQRQ